MESLRRGAATQPPMENVLQRTTPLARRQTLFVVVFLVVVVLFVTTFCMGVVRGSSMDPTYQDGQVVLVRRRNLFNNVLHRNDVVLLQRDRGEVIIKRIFLLPGDEVPFGYPFVLGMNESRGLQDYYEQQTIKRPDGAVKRFSVPRGYIVVLGDNPDVSEDSRFFGPVPISSIIGTVANAPGPPPTPQVHPTSPLPVPGRSTRPIDGTAPQRVP